MSGRVVFKGSVPPPSPIKLGADPVCEAAHEGKLFTEDVLVNDDGTLRNVFVYIKQGLTGRKFSPPHEPVVLDQSGCLYHPHVQGIQVGQPLLIRNSDDTLHNIHALTEKNDAFNLGQPMRGMESRKMFTKPEVMIHFKCDVHPWMSCYLGVLDHPFFAVTGDGGTFALTNVPAGDYIVEAWHEKVGTQTANVHVDKDETKTIDFTFTN
ncbi:MAG TPA: carboxypeptidase regulatory-like domain-containing protein [Verrucomicrobiae bacterium]|nr:carboxypeptidase regulatory-like domain-containing protein [Verrucomicrobiae bacterium]